MAKSEIYIKPENRGKFTAYKKRTGKTTSEALHSRDPHVRQMANFARNAKKWRKEYGGSLDELYDMYSFGGWLKNNVGNILQTAAGVGSMFVPVPGAQIAGMGMIAQGVGGMASSAGQQDEISEVYKPPVSKARQTYDTPMAYGGNLKALSQRTDYRGNTHEGGGIKLPGMGVEVEGEESRTGDMIHSDKIKIDKNIYKTYKDMVPLKKSDIGKSVAQVLKRQDKRFEKRSGDLWNDQARIASQKPFEMMSDELSTMYNNENNMMPYGGTLPINANNPIEIPEVAVYGRRKIPAITETPVRKSIPSYTPSGAGNWTYYPGQDSWVSRSLRTSENTPVTLNPDEFESKYNNVLLRPGYRNKKYGGYTKAQEGLNLSNIWDNTKSYIGKEGNAPIIGSGISALTNILRRPERVSYEQARFTPTQFTPMDVSGGINRIRRSYGDARARMKRINPRGYMNTLASIGASEAESIGDYSAGVGNVNAQMRNRAYAQDAETRNRMTGMNTEIAMREAEANAANRGMRRTAIDASLNNMFTQMGQSARDKELYKQQDKYIDMMGDVYKGMQSIYGNQSKTDPYALLPWDSSTPGNYPIDTTPILPTSDIEYIEPSYLKPFSRYGGRLSRLNTLRLKR